MSFLSCEKEIPIDGDYQTSSIVLNGLFGVEDTVLSVYITKTKSIAGYAKNYAVVDDATVHLYKNEVDMGKFVYDEDYGGEANNGSHYVFSDIVLDSASNYSVKLQIPDMGEAEAATTFPTMVKIEKIELKEEQVYISDYEETFDAVVAYVTFVDPSGEDNYYQMADGYYEVAKKGYRYDYNNIVYLKDTLSVNRYEFPENDYQIDALIVQDDGLFDDSENMFTVFDDELIDGKSYTMRYVVARYEYLSELDTAAGEYAKVHFGLRYIPKDLYKYYVSAEQFYWNDGTFFSEPVQVYTNVENGVGILSSYIEDYCDGIYGEDNKEGKVYLDY